MISFFVTNSTHGKSRLLLQLLRLLFLWNVLLQSPPLQVHATNCTSQNESFVLGMFLQLSFSRRDGTIICDSSESSIIRDNIQMAFVEAFPLIHPDWALQVQDEGAFIDFGSPLLALSATDEEYNDVRESCPERPSDEDVGCGQSANTADGNLVECHWGCLPVAYCSNQADYNIPETADWPSVASFVDTWLSGLAYDCLGGTEELRAILLPFPSSGSDANTTDPANAQDDDFTNNNEGDVATFFPTTDFVVEEGNNDAGNETDTTGDTGGTDDSDIGVDEGEDNEGNDIFNETDVIDNEEGDDDGSNNYNDTDPIEIDDGEDENEGTQMPIDDVNVTTFVPTNATGCDICNGGEVDASRIMWDGTPCTDWFNQLSVPAQTLLDADSDFCLINRLYAAAWCGCPMQFAGEANCSVCTGAVIIGSPIPEVPGFTTDLEVPDITGVNCGFLQQLPPVDLSETCFLLYDKYANFCGCQDAPAPSCFLCDGEPEDLPLPGDTRNRSCFDLNTLYSVQTPEICEQIKDPATSEVDYAAVCCPEVDAPYECGEFVCPDGSTAPPDERLDLDIPGNDGLTCKALYETYPYATLFCSERQEMVGFCCGEDGDVSTASPEGSGNSTCQLCDGGEFLANSIFPDGNRCGLLLDESGEFRAETEGDCAFERAAAAKYCGCSVPAGFCNICAETVVDSLDGLDLDRVSVDRLIPGDITFTCGELFELPALDDSNTCTVLHERYSILCGCEDPGVTISNVLNEESAQLELFWSMVQQLNIDKLLIGGENYTVFAPSDEALQNDELVQVYNESINSWAGHLVNMLENHFIPGRFFTEDLLNGGVGTLETLVGESLRIDSEDRSLLVGNQSLKMFYLAQNGLVYETNGLLHPSWSSMSILEVLENGGNGNNQVRRLQIGEFSTLLSAITSSDRYSEIAEFKENGTTIVAPVDSAFEETNIDGDTENILRYHLVGKNNYFDYLENGTQIVLPTGHPTADVLVTVDENGVVRYNDVVVDREILARNGILHSSDKVLLPTSMVDFLGYVQNFTAIGVRIINDLFLASGWDLKNLTGSLQEEGNRFTLIAPVDEVFTGTSYGISTEVIERFATEAWSRHLNEFLINRLVPDPYTMYQISEELGDIRELDTLGGNTIVVDAGNFFTSDGMALDLSANCTDGIVHFVANDILLPRALAYDAFNYILYEVPNATTFVTRLGELSLDSKIREPAAPITVFVPPDSRWGDIPQDKLQSILENHIFEGLLFLDQLQEMDGEVINSVNGKEWTVSIIDGATYLGNPEFSVSVPVLSSNDTLVRNGVIQYLDSLLDESKSPTPSPSQRNATEARNCSACSGTVDSSKTLPDGLPCSIWSQEVSLLDASSEACHLEKSVGVEYCGCLAPESPPSCHPCPGTQLSSSTVLPDARGMTCASLAQLVSVDGQSTCDKITEKYASFCGCPSAPEPTCSFCAGGFDEKKPFIIPGEANTTFTFRMFGQLPDTSCQGFSNFYSVQTSASCSNNTQELMKNMFFDMNSWCCSGASPPKHCGEFCHESATLQETLVLDEDSGLTCRQLSEIYAYIKDESYCQEAANATRACCFIPPLTVNVSFAVSNQQGLSSADLASSESAKVLNAALQDFAANLVAEVESSRQERALQQSKLLQHARKLLATLQPNSAEVFALQAVNCPTNRSLPVGSGCHNVFGHFKLLVEDEDPEVVAKRYEGVTDRAIVDGKLQESIDKTDSSFPFTVIGVAVTDQDQSRDLPSDGEENMSWWLILFIVLASVFGFCGICCILAYCESTRQARKSSNLEADAEAAPLTESLLGDQESKNPEDVASLDEENPDNEHRGKDTSAEDSSGAWEDSEHEEAVMVEELSVHSDKQFDDAEMGKEVPDFVEVDDDSDDHWEDEDPLTSANLPKDQHSGENELDCDSDWDDGDTEQKHEDEQVPLVEDGTSIANESDKGEDINAASSEDKFYDEHVEEQEEREGNEEQWEEGDGRADGALEESAVTNEAENWNLGEDHLATEIVPDNTEPQGGESVGESPSGPDANSVASADDPEDPFIPLRTSEELDAEIAAIEHQESMASAAPAAAGGDADDDNDEEGIEELKETLAGVDLAVSTENPEKQEYPMEDDSIENGVDISKVQMDDGSDENIEKWDDEDPTEELKMEHMDNSEAILEIEHANNLNQLELINAKREKEEILNNWPDTTDDEGGSVGAGDDDDEQWDDEDQTNQAPEATQTKAVDGPLTAAGDAARNDEGEDWED